MSTRANIIITDSYGDKIWFYRHSDGYPEGTMPTLQKFMDYVNKGLIRDNAQQAAGWLIIIGAEEYKGYQIPRPQESYENLTPEQEKDWWGKIPSTPKYWKVGAYEPTVGQHGDIEWLYTVNVSTRSITYEQV